MININELSRSTEEKSVFEWKGDAWGVVKDSRNKFLTAVSIQECVTVSGYKRIDTYKIRLLTDGVYQAFCYFDKRLDDMIISTISPIVFDKLTDAMNACYYHYLYDKWPTLKEE